MGTGSQKGQGENLALPVFLSSLLGRFRSVQFSMSANLAHLITMYPGMGKIQFQYHSGHGNPALHQKRFRISCRYTVLYLCGGLRPHKVSRLLHKQVCSNCHALCKPILICFPCNTYLSSYGLFALFSLHYLCIAQCTYIVNCFVNLSKFPR